MDKITITNILNMIKELRLNEGISQAEMAKKVEMSTSFYGMLERGNRSLSVEHLFKIAKAFDCDVSDLLIMAETV